MLKNILNTIIRGDTIEELKKIKSETVDFIFADPPYFMQTEGELLRTNGTKFDGVEDDWDKFTSFQEYDNFCEKWLKECKRILKKNGSICVIGSFQNIYRIGYLMQNLEYWIINDIIWNKSNPVPNFSGTRLCNSHETMIWCARDKKSRVTFNYKTMKYLNNGKQEKSVWNIPICNGNERLKDENGYKLHSTQKPEKLVYKMILSATKPNDVILDPFFGTGTTGAVAKKLGRNYIGIEREKKYINGAEKRIKATKIEIDKISNLELEIKPPKVPMKKLLDNGYLKWGQKLYSKDKKYFCKVVENGNVFDGEEELSIHKMSAKFLKRVNNNGWDYFFVNYNGDFIELNKLRYLYTEEKNGK
jgi:modification methylase hinfI